MITLKRLLLVLGICILAACAPQFRSLAPQGTIQGNLDLFGLEVELRDGVLSLKRSEPGKVRRRIAVVIGNSAYTNVPALVNPSNDARAVATMFEQNGFQVLRGFDLTKLAFENLLREATVAGGPGAEIVAFYAGHGVQIDDKNFMVPVDVALSSADDLPFQTVRLDSLFRILDDRSSAHLSFLDACRNNPFGTTEVKAGITRGTSMAEEGYTQPKVPTGGLVAYATEPGEVAYDGEGQPNSPYTAALLNSIRSAPRADIERILRQVRRSVRSATGNLQTPVYTSRLTQKFAFAAPREDVVLLASVDMRPVRSDAAPETTGDRLTLDVPMEKTIAVGARLGQALFLPDETSLRIQSPPASGRLALLSGSGTLSFDLDQAVPVTRLGALVYLSPPTQTPGGQTVPQQSMIVALSTPGQPMRRITVTLRPTPNACDVEAGDWLDLQGPGIYRRKSEFSNTRALNACTAATTSQPNSARFQFLLGKALEANNQTAAALEAYRKALAMGHIRAAAAIFALTGPGPVSLTVLQNAADQGDPFAIIALGEFKLKSASPVERAEAYDLLSLAIDLGIPEAMRVLERYYADPASPDHDPERAVAFGREAAEREQIVYGRRAAAPDRLPGGFRIRITGPRRGGTPKEREEPEGGE